MTVYPAGPHVTTYERGYVMLAQDTASGATA